MSSSSASLSKKKSSHKSHDSHHSSHHKSHHKSSRKEEEYRHHKTANYVAVTTKTPGLPNLLTVTSTRTEYRSPKPLGFQAPASATVETLVTRPTKWLSADQPRDILDKYNLDTAKYCDALEASIRLLKPLVGMFQVVAAKAGNIKSSAVNTLWSDSNKIMEQLSPLSWEYPTLRKLEVYMTSMLLVLLTPSSDNKMPPLDYKSLKPEVMDNKLLGNQMQSQELRSLLQVTGNDPSQNDFKKFEWRYSTRARLNEAQSKYHDFLVELYLELYELDLKAKNYSTLNSELQQGLTGNEAMLQVNVRSVAMLEAEIMGLMAQMTLGHSTGSMVSMRLEQALGNGEYKYQDVTFTFPGFELGKFRTQITAFKSQMNVSLVEYMCDVCIAPPTTSSVTKDQATFYNVAKVIQPEPPSILGGSL